MLLTLFLFTANENGMKLSLLFGEMVKKSSFDDTKAQKLYYTADMHTHIVVISETASTQLVT